MPPFRTSIIQPENRKAPSDAGWSKLSAVVSVIVGSFAPITILPCTCTRTLIDMAAAATEPLLLYSARVCPWAQRATLALEETGLPHSIYEIDLQVSPACLDDGVQTLTAPLQNKPAWYNSKVNPASKVPGEQVEAGVAAATGHHLTAL
jgi:hypothetical protein